VARPLPRALAKVGSYAVVLTTALTVNFLLPRLAPGNAIDHLAGDGGTLTPQARAALTRQFDLDGSLLSQFGRYWERLAHGDLGMSVRYRRPVTELLLERLPWTVLLVGTALVLSLIIGVLCGAAAAVRRDRGRRGDAGAVTSVLVLQAMPSFWVGMVLVALFAVNLGWLPSFGAAPLRGSASGVSWLVEVGRHLVLPAATLTLGTIGSVFLLVRASMVSTFTTPYMLMAEAKGVTASSLTFRHALRNALLPAYTHLTLSVGMLLSGAVVVETVFAYPGMGRLIYEAVEARDYQLMQGAFLLTTLAVLMANVLADVTYPLLDPRVRHPRTAGAMA
jgi:peptide/nickel transport system permease protein